MPDFNKLLKKFLLAIGIVPQRRIKQKCAFR